MVNGNMHSTDKSFKQRFLFFLGNYLRLILGILAFLFGAVFMFIPFIPLGYILIFIAVLFLSTYIPPLKRLLQKLKEKDKKGIIEKYDHKMDDMEDSLKEESRN